MKITTSAPGKAILMGEHAAVYGRPALVAAVDRRVHVELEEAAGREVRLELPDIGVTVSSDWRELQEYAALARKRWEVYAERPSPRLFARVRGDGPAHLVRVALGETAEVLGADSLPGAVLRLTSQLPIGAGFGSSAACAVAIARAVIGLAGQAITSDELERLGLEIERRQHGTPSGIDSATVIHGGVVWARRDASGRFKSEPIELRARGPLAALHFFSSGTPSDSTGEVVAAVRARRDADKPGFERVLDRMTAATEEGRRVLTDPESRPGELIPPIRDIEACLEHIGVVPPELRALFRQIEAAGGAAKISGAGSLRGPAAGSVLVVSRRPEDVAGWPFLGGLEALAVRLGAPGVRIEAGQGGEG